MKKLIAGSLVMLLAACSAAVSEQTTKPSAVTVQKRGNITNYETTGNLAVTAPTACVDVNQLSSDHTPADIYTGISDCLAKDDVDRAAKLSALAFVYGYYDRLRVADRSAHQAMTVLQMNHFSGVDDDVAGRMSARVGQISDDGAALEALCDDIRSLGMPSYHPAYMIQHGIQAFSGGQDGSGLVPGFSEQEGWQKVLDQGLHCPA
ncbi:MAG: hypothetical protein ACR2RA_25500 [Geminicoccaceae bacterium]